MKDKKEKEIEEQKHWREGKRQHYFLLSIFIFLKIFINEKLWIGGCNCHEIPLEVFSLFKN